MEKKRVLILSPHTDDAELGCGGTIIKYLNSGHELFWCVFSTAEDSVPVGQPKSIIRDEFLQVCNELHLSNDQYKIHNYGVRRLPENRQNILDILIDVKRHFNPSLVIGPSLNDFHQDHQVVANEMIRAFKSSSSIISYELPWNHITFSNQMFVKLDIEHIMKKIHLLSFYSSQIMKKRNYFSNEFILGLAKIRGVQINTDYAEAFEVIRWIE